MRRMAGSIPSNGEIKQIQLRRSRQVTLRDDWTSMCKNQAANSLSKLLHLPNELLQETRIAALSLPFVR